MKIKCVIFALALALSTFAFGCSRDNATRSGENVSRAASPEATKPSAEGPSPLPNEGFKAQINLMDPPEKLRAGQKMTIQVKVKNVSNVVWWARGAPINTRPDNKFYIAAGNRWLKSDGKTLVSNMDGRHGLEKDLKPGEEKEVPLQITAPKEPGDYILEIDLIQEQVAWFSDKGSQTAKTKVSVVK